MASRVGTHNWSDDRCSLCGMLSHWNGAAQPCLSFEKPRSPRPKRPPKPKKPIDRERDRERIRERRARMSVEERRAEWNKYQRAKRARDKEAGR